VKDSLTHNDREQRNGRGEHSPRHCVFALNILLCLLAFLTASLPAAQIPWKLETYTLVARDMDLRTTFDTFAAAQELSVVMSPSVTGVFSGSFKDIPSGEFLERLATAHNLIWYYDGAALYIYGAGEISTMLLDLKYMRAAEVREMISELGVEDARFPLKTASDDQLLMVSGPPRYVALVAEMVAKADKLRENRVRTEVETRMFPLAYTWADDVSFDAESPESSLTIKGVATLLKEIMDSSDSGVRTRDTASKEELSDLEMAQLSAIRPVIRAENRLNAVIVRDAVSRMPMYERLIAQLDVPQKLVEIDVTVVELSQENALDWQLSLSYSGTHGRSNYGAGQNAANLFSTDSIAGMGLAGALTHVHSTWALATSLTALREKGKARNISRTSLLTVNNMAAEMTDTQSYHTKVVGTEVATLQEVSAGTTLQVKPRILPATLPDSPDCVWLSLELDDGGFESISVDSMPMTRSSTLTTQTAVFMDESIMLAGYLRDIEEDAGWGIPYLRDIPWIGWIFGGKSSKKETVQRMFIITPHIVDLNQETLLRLQGTRLRDTTVADEVAKNLDEEDEDDEEQKAVESQVVDETTTATAPQDAEQDAAPAVEPTPAPAVEAQGE
jgi:type III secretion protein C